jgi:hypothetical protein
MQIFVLDSIAEINRLVDNFYINCTQIDLLNSGWRFSCSGIKTALVPGGTAYQAGGSDQKVAGRGSLPPDYGDKIIFPSKLFWQKQEN